MVEFSPPWHFAGVMKLAENLSLAQTVVGIAAVVKQTLRSVTRKLGHVFVSQDGQRRVVVILCVVTIRMGKIVIRSVTAGKVNCAIL